MAKIQLKTEIKSIDGITIVIEDGKTPCTLGMVCRAALMAPSRTGEISSIDEKLMRGKLAESMLGDPELELKSDQIVLLKKLINENYNQNLHIVISAVKALEP